MEKRKLKVWQKVLIIIGIVLIIFIVNIVRKVSILYDLDKKVTDYENNNDNIYIKTIYDFNDYKSEMERFIKGDIDKMVINKTDLEGKNTKIIQITYPHERKFYTEAEGNKMMSKYEEEAGVRGAHIEDDVDVSYTVIMNFAYSISLPERILNSIVTKIRTVEIDGIKCYELSSMSNSNVLYSKDTVDFSVFVNKDTGLPVKMIEKIKNDGEVKENITMYKYELNVVTDEDIKEPDETQYKVQS